MSKKADLWINPLMVKSLREKLCVLQQQAISPQMKDFYGDLIDQLDAHRPLGPDGKHGNGPRCTQTCGCEERDADV